MKYADGFLFCVAKVNLQARRHITQKPQTVWREFGIRAQRILHCLFFTLIFCASPVCAQIPFRLIISEQLRSTFTLVGSGARAAGMGGAFTAVADDATAASFNPAGLAQLVIPEASIVFDRIDLNDNYRDFLVLDPIEPPLPLTDSAVSFKRNDFNFLSFTVPFQIRGRRWATQFSTQKVVDFTYHGDRQFSELDPELNPLVDVRQKSDQSGGIRLYSGSFAISATRRMLVGVTANRWKGSWSFLSLTSETLVDDPEDFEFLTYSQSNSLSGWNFDLGMLLRYKYANVGIHYRSGFSADYSLAAEVETNITDESLDPLPDTNTKLDWPSTLAFGVAIKPSDRLTLAADFSQTDWSKMLFDTQRRIGKVNFFDLQPPKTTLVSTGRDWRIGAEYLFFHGSTVFPVRAGWFYEPQPGIDANTGKRFVSEGYSAGAGIKIAWFAADFAYQRRTSTNPLTLFDPEDPVFEDISNPAVGTLHRVENRFFASTIVQVPPNSFLDRLFRVIFVGPAETSD